MFIRGWFIMDRTIETGIMEDEAKELFLTAIVKVEPQVLSDLNEIYEKGNYTKASLQPWADRYNLHSESESDWIIESAFNSMELWEKHNTKGLWLSNEGQMVEPFIVELPGHIPGLFNRAEAKALYRKLFEKELDSYLKRLEGKRKRRTSEEHFLWLAKRNVNQLTYEEIADEYLRKDEKKRTETDDRWKTVKDGIKTAAKLCDIKVHNKR